MECVPRLPRKRYVAKEYKFLRRDIHDLYQTISKSIIPSLMLYKVIETLRFYPT